MSSHAPLLFALVLLLLLSSTLPGTTPEAPPDASENRPKDRLPEGEGLSARYPGDEGLAKDPQVLFFEDFEEGDLEEIGRRWGEVSNRGGKVLRLVDGSPAGSRGRRALQMTATLEEDTGGHLYRKLPRGVDTAYARFYVKIAPDAGYIHHFVHLGGYNPATAWPQGGAGVRPRGDDRVTVGIEPWGEGGRRPPPGIWTFYAYWHEMKVSADGKYWGNGLRRRDPALVPADRWQAVEMMLKLNSEPGASDGELALWLDGKLAAHFARGARRGPWTGMGFHLLDEGGEPFEGFRWRTVKDLQINFFWLLLYVTERPGGQANPAKPGSLHRVWFDNVVISTSYIGPLRPMPGDEAAAVWKRIEKAFRPPDDIKTDEERYPSPLQFRDGAQVKTPEDWKRRRREILETWNGLLGAWPPVIERPEVESLGTERREGILQTRVRFAITPEHKTEGYLLEPEGAGPRPAVLVVYYDPETAIGKGKSNLDFAWQLARRGFTALSIGLGASLYYPDEKRASLQPLSALAYAAANAYHVLSSRPGVDPARIGIIGHSYGAKWAMFASCLYDKFACAVWSDGGIVFDEKRPNVNYWEPWYLGYEAGTKRKPGVPDGTNPRTGPYKLLVEKGHDLHELQALMAPRPFLVSGGSEDPPERWKALRHAVEVNRLLGYEDRVAMTNREEHSPNPESNEQAYLFLEYFLKHGKAAGR